MKLSGPGACAGVRLSERLGTARCEGERTLEFAAPRFERERTDLQELQTQWLKRLSVDPGYRPGWMMMTRVLVILGGPPRTVLDRRANGNCGPTGKES